ncbi:LPXTG cell wall anchor domain-containing protein [Streptacidiphilus cavernicola]|uniref:LPXTG cell wall anchor domain-containing protein n=1 Tax=Streptacidiphilus cavernicola TaxID=3342716 RepID=A0ABV6W099_9ACTN
MRVAAAALALSGAGLMVTGVANAVTAPSLAPGKVINGPLDLPGDEADVPTSTPTSTPTGDAAPDTTAPADTGSTTDPAADPTSVPATTVTPGDDPSGSATAGGSATGTPTATGDTAAGGATGATGGDGGTMAQPTARQTLAETGSDHSVPYLLAGGFTLLAGGLVFRFGPRTAAPRHGA